MSMPTAILIGFFMVSVAIVAGQFTFIRAANAQLDQSDYRMFSSGLSEIADAIRGIRACRD